MAPLPYWSATPSTRIVLLPTGVPLNRDVRTSEGTQRFHGQFLPLDRQHLAVLFITIGIRWCRATTTQTNGRVVIFQAFLNIDNSNLPFPQVQGVADVEKFFLPVKLSPEAVELLTVI